MFAVRIVSDAAIPLAGEAFAHLGEVSLVPGDSISPALVRDAELLLVRSTTRVDARLLQGSRVRFVASATTGVDHIDEDSLTRRGIHFASAAGCNSNSVAEYVVAVLLSVAERRNMSLRGKSIGIVGAGRIGSLVERAAKTLGLKVLLNDPPLGERTGGPRFLGLDELMDVDFLTLHVPLTRSGLHPTFHLFDEHRLGQLNPRTLLINTSRGSVVKGTALCRQISSGNLGGAVLDVWEDEPNIDFDLLERVDFGTPHVAGYSLDGKLNGTRMIYEAACSFLGRLPRWSNVSLPAAHSSPVDLRGHQGGEEDALLKAVSSCYDVSVDDRRLRDGKTIHPDQRGSYFSGLRKSYPIRREFRHTRVLVKRSQKDLGAVLDELGFRVGPN